MKTRRGVNAICLVACISVLSLQGTSQAAVSENDTELITTGDFDGDGSEDVVIVDKETGKYRMAYRTRPGVFEWPDFRISGLQHVSSAASGKLFDPKRDALVLASGDGNKIFVVEARIPNKSVPGMEIPFTRLGPSVVVAIDAGGAGNTPFEDIFVGCIYETPPKAFLLRNNGKEFAPLAEQDLSGEPTSASRLILKPGGPQWLAYLLKDDDNLSFRLADVSTGTQKQAATGADVPPGSQYFVANFRGTPLPQVVFWQTNANSLQVRTIEESSGRVQIGAPTTLDLGKPVRLAHALPGPGKALLFISYGEAETAELCEWDAAKVPKALLTLTNQINEYFYGAIAAGDALFAFSAPKVAKVRFSTRYQMVQAGAEGPLVKAYGRLPNVESDAWTVPDIHKHIVANLDVTNAGDMRRYTNTIPGTTVKFVMVPIPGGEFVMGSSTNEAGRNPDEGPPVKVRISPFWMGVCEVTWGEYDSFRNRERDAAQSTEDKLADAVSTPSPAYGDITFGMGRVGYPAIAMSHLGATKYCQWLSAKTGQFYRLPTEAEWEYAARAGTTTAYFFGDDPAELDEYAWHGNNSDWVYQRVGKKKPNSWGLHDIYGNVLEWTLDGYAPDYFTVVKEGMLQDPWIRAAAQYPHSARGGSYDDDPPGKHRSASRRGSDPEWNMRDPQKPKSVWWLTDAKWIGFRVVRPLAIPSADQMKQYWTSSPERQ